MRQPRRAPCSGGEASRDRGAVQGAVGALGREQRDAARGLLPVQAGGAGHPAYVQPGARDRPGLQAVCERLQRFVWRRYKLGAVPVEGAGRCLNGAGSHRNALERVGRFSTESENGHSSLTVYCSSVTSPVL